MFFVFFLLWVVFNGRLTWEIAAFGAVLSAVLYAFCCAFMDMSPKKDWAALKRIPKMLCYVGLVIKEIVKANMALTHIVFNRRVEVKPKLVTFETPLRGNITKTVLADSITLTPGTITVLAEGNKLTVHCLDEQFVEGIDDTPFQRALMSMQEEENSHDA